MSTIVTAQRARTAALIAAAALGAIACGETGPLTAPRSLTPAATSTIVVHGPSLSGYALASGRITDSLSLPQGK